MAHIIPRQRARGSRTNAALLDILCSAAPVQPLNVSRLIQILGGVWSAKCLDA